MTGLRLVRVELLKLATTRLSYGLLATSAGLTAVWTTLEASRAGTGKGPAALSTYSGLTSIVTGGVWGLILAGVLGVIISSGEYRHQTATLTYLAAPNRNRVLAAKAVAGAVGGAIFGLAGYAVALAVGLAFTAASRCSAACSPPSAGTCPTRRRPRSAEPRSAEPRSAP